MKHFIFLFHIISFLVGFTGIILSNLAYVKFKTKIIKFYSIFMISLTIILLEQTFISYEIINLLDYFWLNVILNMVEYLAVGVMIYFLPLFIHEFAEFQWTSKKKAFFQTTALFPICSLFLYYALPYKRVVTILSSSVLFLVIVYCLGLSIINFRKIKVDITKRVLKTFLTITIIFLPYMYLDARLEQIKSLRDIFPYGLLSVPTFYLLINLVSIYWGLKYFKTNLDGETSSLIKEPLIEVKNKQEQFLEKINFTNREKELIVLLMKGYTYNQLAEELIISLATVKTHVYNIYRKAGVKNKIELFHLINGDEI